MKKKQFGDTKPLICNPNQKVWRVRAMQIDRINYFPILRKLILRKRYLENWTKEALNLSSKNQQASTNH